MILSFNRVGCIFLSSSFYLMNHIYHLIRCMRTFQFGRQYDSMCLACPIGPIHRAMLYAFWVYDSTWFLCTHTILCVNLDHSKWYQRCVHRTRVDWNTWLAQWALIGIGPPLLSMHPFVQMPNYPHAHNTSRNSWHTIVHRTIQSHVIQSNARQMHHEPDHHLRILDRLNRRMGIVFYSKNETKNQRKCVIFVKIEINEMNMCAHTHLDDIGDLFPLFLCWITAGGIVCACM